MSQLWLGGMHTPVKDKQLWMSQDIPTPTTPHAELHRDDEEINISNIDEEINISILL